MQKVLRALKKLELLSAAPRATQLTHFSCSPNLPRASITRYRDAKHKQILKRKTVNVNYQKSTGKQTLLNRQSRTSFS